VTKKCSIGITEISDIEHTEIDLTFINVKKKKTRAKWRSCKKFSAEICKKLLTERAAFLASKMQTSEEKALKAIIKAERSIAIYMNLKDLLGKQQTIFTQVDVLSDPSNSASHHTTLTDQKEIEHNILACN
jgi:hypothetical protein